jgi:hypothetical protein
LIHHFILESLSDSPHYQFLQCCEMSCFHQTVAGLHSPHTGWVSSAFHPIATRQKQNILPFIGPLVLSREGSTCPLAVLDYVGPSSADYVLCSPGRVADSLSSGMTEAGSTSRLPVHELWQIQDVSDAYRTRSAVLCLCFCFSRTVVKKPQKIKKRKEKATFQWVNG